MTRRLTRPGAAVAAILVLSTAISLAPPGRSARAAGPAGIVPAAGDTTVVELDGWRAPEEARARSNPLAPSEAVLEAATALYRRACAQCHGARGHGDGRLARMLDVPPAALADRVPLQTDGELFWKVTEGRKPMPRFGKDLDETERWGLVHYLRELAAVSAADSSSSDASAIGE